MVVCACNALDLSHLTQAPMLLVEYSHPFHHYRPCSSGGCRPVDIALRTATISQQCLRMRFGRCGQSMKPTLDIDARVAR